MKKKFALIDYGMGNLASVAKALEKAGCAVETIQSPKSLNQFAGVVLPGVGAFSVAMKNLTKQGWVKPIQKWVKEGKPFLGICLGYQLLFEKSSEGRGTKGLALFKGEVKRFPNKKNLRVPHIGWNTVNAELRMKNEERKRKKSSFFTLHSSLFKGLSHKPYFYFVHSYFPVPKDKSLIATETNYGIPFASSISKGNLFASQFHPEKSGENGSVLLRNFLEQTGN